MKTFLIAGFIGFLSTCSESADIGYFWHITDFHWDFSYWAGQLSCNNMNISQPGMFGNQWCDAPWELVKESIKGIKTVKPDVDFILWTGDTVPHVDKSHLSTDKNKELVRNVTQLLKSEFPGMRIYATFGNHDYHPNSQFPPHNNEIYNASYLIWKEWINDGSQVDAFLKGGYYTVLIRSGLRIVAMNTNMYYTKDLVTVNLTDPADQFVWLEEVLKTATANNEKVIITGHVPPGYTTPRKVSWMTDAFNKRLVAIINSNADAIVAMHFGHEHHDSFRLFYDTAGVARVSLFVAPSVTPWRYQLADGEIEPPHNPGARLVLYDRQTGQQLDIIQYYVDLNVANRNNNLTWIRGYSAKELYRIPDISPSSMHNAVQGMKSQSSDTFQAYVKWYNTNASTSNQYPCDGSCYQSVMCGFRYLTEEPFQNCLKSTNESMSVCVVYPTTIFLSVLFLLFCKFID